MLFFSNLEKSSSHRQRALTKAKLKQNKLQIIQKCTVIRNIMTDIFSKLSEITKSEEKERDDQKQLLEISKKISSLKREIRENEIKITVSERERVTLTQECNNLKIQAELQQKQLAILKSNVTKQLNLLQEEKDRLDKIQESIWDKMKEFIHGESCQTEKTENEMTKIKDFIKIRTVNNENQKVKNENIKLEGEMYGLDLFRKFQEKQINQVRKYLTLFQQKATKV